MVMSVANILKIKGRVYKTVRPDETVQEFAEHLREERIGAMIVTRDGQYSTALFRSAISQAVLRPTAKNCPA
jgi:hypothetical protein